MKNLTWMETQAVINALGLRRIELEKQRLSTKENDKLVRMFKAELEGDTQQGRL